MNKISRLKVKGDVRREIHFSDGKIDILEYPNTILRTGRNALAASLANAIGDNFDFYIARMLFGDGGTSGGTTKFVNTNRNGLFGITRASKAVISHINPTVPSQAIFTSVLTTAEANGQTLNEMALQMNNGNLYSMVTFPDLTKTDQMTIHWSWKISII